MDQIIEKSDPFVWIKMLKREKNWLTVVDQILDREKLSFLQIQYLKPREKIQHYEIVFILTQNTWGWNSDGLFLTFKKLSIIQFKLVPGFDDQVTLTS